MALFALLSSFTPPANAQDGTPVPTVTPPPPGDPTNTPSDTPVAAPSDTLSLTPVPTPPVIDAAPATQPAAPEPVPVPVLLEDTRQRPSLQLNLVVGPRGPALGETATITLTVTNQGTAPATQLGVALALPTGALAASLPGRISPQDGWRWTNARLDGGASVVFVATTRITKMPPGEALLLHATATAAELDIPVQRDGGAVVVDRTVDKASARFAPGQRATLKSTDGCVRVEVGSAAFGRVLALTKFSPTPISRIGQPRLMNSGPISFTFTCMARADFKACSACFSSRSGAPQKAMIASPMYLSMVPRSS